MGDIKNDYKKRLKLNLWDLGLLVVSIVVIIALLLWVSFGITKVVDANSRVQVMYNNEVIYDQPISNEFDNPPLTIKREYGVTGDPSQNILPSRQRKEFDFVGPEVQIRIVNNTIQVVQEKSDNKICSRQGVVKYTNTPITCEPNHLIVVIVGAYDSDGPDN